MITIGKAIELITLHFKGCTVREDPDFFDACCLGVEALKRHRDRYKFKFQGDRGYLPGETEE